MLELKKIHPVYLHKGSGKKQLQNEALAFHNIY